MPKISKEETDFMRHVTQIFLENPDALSEEGREYASRMLEFKRRYTEAKDTLLSEHGIETESDIPWFDE